MTAFAISTGGLEYFYDVQAIDGNGDKTTILRGVYNVVQDITKT